MKPFKNIALVEFTPNEEQTSTITIKKEVIYKMSGAIRVGNKLMMVLMDGYNKMLANIKSEACNNLEAKIEASSFLLSLKFNEAFYMSSQDKTTYKFSLWLEEKNQLDFCRGEVELLKLFTEAALTEQELLRDAETPQEVVGERTVTVKFDSELYISLKHLLLDIRLWLCVELTN